jgi:short-subunit dehydrogenase
LCFVLGREGARLGLIDRNENGVRILAAELSTLGVFCRCAVADVRRREEVEAAITILAAEVGVADILVVSAGILRMAQAEAVPIEDVEEILQVNFFGAVYAINAVLPAMLQRQRGHIVGMSSLAAHRGIPFEAAYGASKAALGNYLESIGPGLRQRGIAVTTIYPGFVQTRLLDGAVARLECRSPMLRIVLRIFGPRLLLGVVDPDRAVRRIATGILRRKRTVAFPFSTWLATQFGMRCPAVLYDWAMNRVTNRVGLVEGTEARQDEAIGPAGVKGTV